MMTTPPTQCSTWNRRRGVPVFSVCATVISAERRTPERGEDLRGREEAEEELERDVERADLGPAAPLQGDANGHQRGGTA